MIDVVWEWNADAQRWDERRVEGWVAARLVTDDCDRRGVAYRHGLLGIGPPDDGPNGEEV